MAVSQVLRICRCQVLDNECRVCYYCVTVSDVWYLQDAFGEPRQEVNLLKPIFGKPVFDCLTSAVSQLVLCNHGSQDHDTI